MNPTYKNSNLKHSLLVALLISATLAYDYDYNEFAKNIEINKLKTSPISNKRNLQGDSWRDYRIKLDTDFADTFVQGNAELTTKLEYSKRLIRSALNYFTSRWKVLSSDSMNFTGLTNCGPAEFNQDTRTSINQDFVLAINAFNDNSPYFMAAGACLANHQDRAVAGVIYLNLKNINVNDPQNDYMLTPILIHEIMHAIGFSGYWFDKRGISGTISIGGENRYAITGPKTVAYAKEYYGCENVNGVPLEDGGSSGSAGSHWEKALHPSEVMNPMVGSPLQVSQFTTSVFEDLGYYKMKEGAHQFYTFGKGEGCGFINELTCADNNEDYCGANEWGNDHCYQNHMSKGNCGSTSTFMPNCNAVFPKHTGFCIKEESNSHRSFNFEEYGAHGRCMMLQKNGDNYDAACLTSRCNGENIEIRIAGSIVQCPQEGGEIDVDVNGYTGKVKCPKFDTFCAQFERRCPLDCMGNGLCMANGTCQCLDGFSGKDCNTCAAGLEANCKAVDDDFVQDFNSGNPAGDGSSEEEPSEEESEEPEAPECPRNAEILEWLDLYNEVATLEQQRTDLIDQYNVKWGELMEKRQLLNDKTREKAEEMARIEAKFRQRVMSAVTGIQGVDGVEVVMPHTEDNQFVPITTEIFDQVEGAANDENSGEEDYSEELFEEVNDFNDTI